MLKCRDCDKPAVLYWVKSGVWPYPWNQVQELCPDCLENVIGRPVTLHDLAIDLYKKTMPGQPEVMRGYTRATIYGACQVAGVAPPNDWAAPSNKLEENGAALGAKLAQQTDGAKDVLESLVDEVNRPFP